MDTYAATPPLPPGASAPPPPPPAAQQPPATDMKSMMVMYRVPPVITLLGDPVVTLNLYSGKWSDPGAYATDAGAGLVPVVVLSAPAANFTNATTDPRAPLVVTYMATSAIGGLTSVVTRKLHVVDACSSGGSIEFTCVKEQKCSVNGACGAAAMALSGLFASLSAPSAADGGGSAGALKMPTAVPQLIPPDTTPPTLTLLSGNYPTVAFVTLKGSGGVITTVGVGEAYADPSAVASKMPANNPSQVINLNSAIVVTWLDEVNTQAPTAAGAPFVVTYEVQDFAVPPNKAVMRRRVEVVCSSGETVCTGASGALSCSSGGICGVGGATSMASTMAGAGGSAATVSGTAVLAVLGADTARVRVGTPYGACNGGMGMNCDPGAVATLVEPDDMRTYVFACADQTSDGLSYAAVGLLYCGINVNVPGSYKVTYTVQAGSGPVATGTRTVIVEDDCLPGEALCTTGTCSSDGVCAGNLASTTTGVSDASKLQLVAPPANTPPRLALRTAPGFGSSVSIKQGTLYPMCNSGQVPSEDVPCDLGADAEDNEDGVAVQTSVLLCPPTNCMAAGSCNGHRTFEKDAGKCGLDTSAQVGTTYLLTFVLYDKEGLSATVSRAVTIVSCCPLDRPYLGSESCEAVNCATLSQLESTVAALGGGDIANVLLGSPMLVLLPAASTNLTAAAPLGKPPSNQTVFVVYGTPAPVSLLPCTSVGAVGSCAAAAVQLSADGSLYDLSPLVSVNDVTPVDDGTNDGASAATVLGRCSAPALSLGTCLPGVSVLQYSVPGASQPAFLSVVVEQLAATEFAYTFEPPDGDATMSHDACTIPGLNAPLERSMASAFRGLASVLIVWVLRMYLAAFIILICGRLNQYAKHMPTVPQDLQRMFKWWVQKVRRKAPSNAHIEKVLDRDVGT
ncbi:hypothetical protein FOA52_014230 [Chlamydomonas sp. UWO 241]|nr:hypothetical protein FOA52_014230 [Chlamydomonas sp. UWO 241]